mgnify:CR=1 FL=1
MSAVRDAQTAKTAEAATTQQPHGDPHGLVDALKQIVGSQYVLTDAAATRRYRTGFRFGEGKALAVVRPGTVLEQWHVLQACVAANVIVITQASNTGLTGGSTPDGDHYDRDIVIVSTARMKKVYVIDEGRQVVCLPGATLDQLEKTLKPLGREPHSVIGSSCIGASVFGGVCNNSGGALVRRASCSSSITWESSSATHRSRSCSGSTKATLRRQTSSMTRAPDPIATTSTTYVKSMRIRLRVSTQTRIVCMKRPGPPES